MLLLMHSSRRSMLCLDEPDSICSSSEQVRKYREIILLLLTGLGLEESLLIDIYMVPLTTNH